MESIEKKTLDDSLMAKYIKKIEVVAKIHRDNKSNFAWLKENKSEVYEVLDQTENRLNDVWLKCLDGEATVQDFERAVSAWYGANIQGIKLSAGRRVS